MQKRNGSFKTKLRYFSAISWLCFCETCSTPSDLIRSDFSVITFFGTLSLRSLIFRVQENVGEYRAHTWLGGRTLQQGASEHLLETPLLRTPPLRTTSENHF